MQSNECQPNARPAEMIRPTRRMHTSNTQVCAHLLIYLFNNYKQMVKSGFKSSNSFTNRGNRLKKNECRGKFGQQIYK